MDIRENSRDYHLGYRNGRLDVRLGYGPLAVGFLAENKDYREGYRQGAYEQMTRRLKKKGHN